MNNTTDLVKSIIEGIQEKKGRDIAVANLTKIATAPCDISLSAPAVLRSRWMPSPIPLKSLRENNMASTPRSLLDVRMPFGWQWTMAR